MTETKIFLWTSSPQVCKYTQNATRAHGTFTMHLYRYIAGVIATLCAAAPVHAGTVVVYSALENDEIETYLGAARAALPDVDIRVLRLSSGDLAARLIAEADHPRNDVIWGMAVTDLLDPRIAALLQPVHAPAIDALPARFRDGNGRWFAATGYAAALCINRQALQERHLPAPRSWRELASPIYKGEIAMPDPASSGTGYMLLSSLSDAGRNAPGMRRVAAIGRNAGQVTLSGSAPCKLARIGEFPIGVSFAFAAMQSIRQGYPVDMVLPDDGPAYELEGSALMKGSPRAADATRFLAWTASPQAATLYGGYKEIVSVPGASPTAQQQHDGLPRHFVDELPERDFGAASAVRAPLIMRFKQLTR
jgi:iron(III) transport system substrate-binding protein